MNKRILSLVLALVMVLGTFAVVSAEEAKVPEYTTQKQKIDWLVDNKIVEGHKINEKDTDLDLEGTLTREQATKLIVHVVGKYDLAQTLQGVMRPFPDVDLERWSNGVISVARTEKNAKSGQPIVIGYEDGTFKPEKQLSYAELATMLVRILKDDLTNKMVENAVWATSWMRWADELGILDGVTVANSDAPVSRADAFEMIFNTIYKLGKYKGNKAEFGINMGIVSKLQAGKIEINQDKEKTYNITYNTKIVNNVTGGELAANAVIPGSLVRYIVDADKNIERILVMSTPEVGYGTNFANYSGYHTTSNDRVFGVGEGVLGKVKGTLNLNHYYKPYADTIEVKENGVAVGTVEVTGDTRVFVADPKMNALKEYKSIEDALRVFNEKKEYKGFAIYDTYRDYRGGKLYEATVLVFTETDKANFSTNTYRVRYDVNSKYFAGLEEANNGKIVSVDFAGVNFLPGSYNTYNMDVVSFGNPIGDANDAYAKTIIDYSADPVYEIVSISDRYITLRTEAKYNREAKIGMPTSTKVFNNGNALRKGDHVQISRFATASNVKAISVVDLPLRGPINLGTENDMGLIRAYVSTVSESVHNGYKQVTIYDKDRAGNEFNFRTLFVAAKENEKLIPGGFYEFRVNNGLYWADGIPVAIEWKMVNVVVNKAIDAYEAAAKKAWELSGDKTSEAYKKAAAEAELAYEKAYTAINNLPTETAGEREYKQNEIDRLNALRKMYFGDAIKARKLTAAVNPNAKFTTVSTYGEVKNALTVLYTDERGNTTSLTSDKYGIKGHAYNTELKTKGEHTLTVVYNGLEAEVTINVADVAQKTTKLTNVGKCDLTIIAVDGKKLAEPKTLAADATTEDYKSYQTLTIKGNCDNKPCKFVGLELVSNCTVLPTGEPGCNSFTVEGSKCCSQPGIDCEDCTVEIRLGECENKIKALGEEVKDVTFKATAYRPVEACNAGVCVEHQLKGISFMIGEENVTSKFTAEIIKVTANEEGKVVVKVRFKSLDPKYTINGATEGIIEKTITTGATIDTTDSSTCGKIPCEVKNFTVDFEITRPCDKPCAK